MSNVDFKKKYVCMIGYSIYMTDTRIRREADLIASLPGYHVKMLALKEDAAPKTFTLNGVEVQELNIQKYRGKSNFKYIVSYFHFMILAFIECNRLLFNKRIDIIHVHNMPNFVVFAAIIPYLFRKKIVLDVHDTMVETYAAKFGNNSSRTKRTLLSSILRLEEKISCAITNRIVCVNQIQKEALVKRGIPENKITVLLNVPDPKRLTNSVKRHEKDKSNNKYKIVYHGTMAKRLGVDLAIYAVAELKNKVDGLEFLIIGHGDDMEEFISLGRELRSEEYIHFREPVPYEELVDLLGEMDLEVIPNPRNAATELMLPVKLLDCVAVGIPVVAPRLKAIEHYFSDNMLTFYEPESVEALSGAILYTYHHRAESAQKAINAGKFLEKYGWDTHKFDLINMYHGLS